MIIKESTKPLKKACIKLLIACSATFANNIGYAVPSSKELVIAEKFSISGISSGGFMAVQMATIFSNDFIGVGSVAGGFFYCAKNGLQEQIAAGQNNLLGMQNLLLFEPSGKLNPQTLAPEFRPSVNNPIYMSVGICMGNPRLAKLPSLSQFEYDQKIQPLDNFKKLQVYIYNGQSDTIVRNTMVQKLQEFYLKNGVKKKQIKITQTKGGHNFPTKKNGLNSCDSQNVPYVASCNYDAAGDILSHLLKKPLQPMAPEMRNLFIVDQTLDHQNININHLSTKDLKQPTKSVSSYGYLYASDTCLNSPERCHMHVALHGCEMSDSFDKDFDDSFQKQIINYKIMGMRSEQDRQIPMTNLPTIEERNNKFGAYYFARNSGFIEYAEKNNLMILFPQTWITEDNYPYNPKGCWDWYGWTGANYATQFGAEPQWLINYIKKIKKEPKSYILNIKNESLQPEIQ